MQAADFPEVEIDVVVAVPSVTKLPLQAAAGNALIDLGDADVDVDTAVLQSSLHFKQRFA
jgi:hypothetical protein